MKYKAQWVWLFVVFVFACEGTTEVRDVEDTNSRDLGSVADVSDSVDDTGPGDLGPDLGADLSGDSGEADMRIEDMAPDLSEDTTSAGCIDGAGLAEGEHTFMLEERERRYILRLPNGYDGSRAWPLVFALHGNGGSAGYWDSTSGDRNIRGVLEDEAILVVAEAIGGNWRDYDADRSTWPARIESELLYFEEILSQVRADLCIDDNEIFSMGFSGGGSFSGVLGCRRDDIRAIAVGGSVIYFDEENCVGTPAAWITIGTGELSDSREAYRDFFRDRAGCDSMSVDTEPAPCVAYEACESQTPVHYCQHPDGHIWPDFGSQAMWDFFAQFVD